MTQTNEGINKSAQVKRNAKTSEQPHDGPINKAAGYADDDEDDDDDKTRGSFAMTPHSKFCVHSLLCGR